MATGSATRNDVGQMLHELQKWGDGVTKEVDYTYMQASGKAGTGDVL